MCICSMQFSEPPDNQSLSVLTYTPTVDDDGKFLTCKAENMFIPNSAIEDKWRLVVHCKYIIMSIVGRVIRVSKYFIVKTD